jgi:ribonuclease P protein component
MTRGYKIVTPFFVTYTLHQPEGQVSQLGITASRKVGKAIARNRLKRLLREWFRHTRERLPHPVACVIIVRPRANQENNTTLWRTLEPVIQRSAQSGKRHRNA